MSCLQNGFHFVLYLPWFCCAAVDKKGSVDVQFIGYNLLCLCYHLNVGKDANFPFKSTSFDGHTHSWDGSICDNFFSE